MARISNAQSIADIEYVIDAPSLGSDKAAWTVHGVTCQRDRHRFSRQAYSFAFEVLHLRHEQPRKAWQVVIVTEPRRFERAKGEPRGTKSLLVLQGKAADVPAWRRHNREQKMRRLAV